MYRLLPVPSSWNVEEVRPVVQIMARITSKKIKYGTYIECKAGNTFINLKKIAYSILSVCFNKKI